MQSFYLMKILEILWETLDIFWSVNDSQLKKNSIVSNPEPIRHLVNVPDDIPLLFFLPVINSLT